MEKYLMFGALLLLTAIGTWLLLRFLPGKSKVEEIWPRLFGGVVLSEIFLAGIYFVAPQQAEVIYYKFALVIASTFLAIVLDRCAFPYSRPDGYLKNFWQHGTKEPIGEADYEIVEGYRFVFALVTLRRGLIIVAVVLGVTLGL